MERWTDPHFVAEGKKYFKPRLGSGDKSLKYRAKRSDCSDAVPINSPPRDPPNSVSEAPIIQIDEESHGQPLQTCKIPLTRSSMISTSKKIASQNAPKSQ